MNGPNEASQLAADALTLWEAGDLSAAEAKYRQALAHAPNAHWGTPLVRAQFATVLSELNRDDEAREQWSQTLLEERALAEGEDSAGVRSTRYFFAKHLLKMGLAQDALDEVAPLHGPRCEWLVKELESEALVVLGRLVEARAACEAALHLARTESQREALVSRLAELREATDQAG